MPTTSMPTDPMPLSGDDEVEADIAAHAPPEPKTFAELGVDPAIVAALAADGILTAFPIQELTLPLALAGQDLIGQAKTGTGKTLGFGIPLLMKLTAPGDPGFAEQPDAVRGKPQALVIVPTRELGIQVAGDLAKTGAGRGIRVLSVYGGRAYEPQVEALKAGIEVVVGTPGRLIDLAQQRHLDLGHVRVLVLDEADEMLDMGFLPDVERLVSRVPAVRQTMLFSATMPGSIVALARRYMTQPTHIRAINATDESALVDAIEQHVYRAHSMDKNELIARALQADGRGLTMVFCRTKRNAQRVADDLEGRGFAVAAVHGDLGQGAREQALRAFRNGKVDVLVATDVAARGIDVADVTHVINWECPDDEKTYLHRIGRTGRAGNSGVAITLVDWDDMHRWKMINQALGLPFAEPVETYSNSEHVYTGLGIPAGTTGVLPKKSRNREGLDAERVEDLGETGKASGRRAHSGDLHSTSGSGRDRDSRGSGDRGRRTTASGPRRDDPAASRREEPAERAARTDRQRRRTRGGSTAAGGAAAPAAESGSSSSGTNGPAVTATGSQSSESTPRPDGAPRRRRRGGRGRGGAGEQVADRPAS
ncbi:MAG TPA: DEAD/DEAH box helicase [Candidatus Nanopelagicales bacterium]